ncbi:MAG TPA: C40 family peptidase [Gaiellaceae bacterium]
MSVLFVALVRPLAEHAPEAAAATGKKQTLRHSHRSRHRRRHHHHLSSSRQTFGHRVVKYARRFSGVPYSWGGSSPRTGFDCSGFVRYVYEHFGISLPHSSYGDLSHGRRVLRKYLKPGDIVFFGGGEHVGIYLAGNRVIDALHTGTVVHVRTMSDWYSSSYYTARRFAHAHGAQA